MWFFFWSPFAANPKRGASTAPSFGRPWPALSSPATAPSARRDASVSEGGDKIERAQADPEMAGLVQAEKARAEVKNLELNWNTELTVCDIGAGECLPHSIIYLVKHPARSTQNEVFVTREGCALRIAHDMIPSLKRIEPSGCASPSCSGSRRLPCISPAAPHSGFCFLVCPQFVFVVCTIFGVSKTGGLGGSVL